MAGLDFLIRKIRFSAALKALKTLEANYKRPLSILDAGGGLQTIAPLLEKRGHRVIVCDNAVVGGRADVVCDLERSLPFFDGSFDVVMALAVVEHLDNWAYAMFEMKRVGRFVVLTTPSGRGNKLLRLLLALRLVHPMTGGHKCCLSSKEFDFCGYKAKSFFFGLNQLAMGKNNIYPKPYFHRRDEAL